MNPTNFQRRILSASMAFLLLWMECFSAQASSILATASHPSSSLSVQESFNNSSSSYLRPRLRSAVEVKTFLKRSLAGAGYVAGTPVLKETGNPWILNIRDIHSNEEAQKNIAAVIEQLVSMGSVDLILLEGESKPLDFSVYRTAPDRELVKSICDLLLKKGVISGPAFLGFTSSVALPPMDGLEKSTSYQANINALKEALNYSPQAWRSLNLVSSQLEDLKKRYLNTDLIILDSAMQRFDQGKMKLASTVRFLKHQGAPLNSIASALMDFNSSHVGVSSDFLNQNLKSLMDQLSRRLDPEELAQLTDKIFSLQQNEMTAPVFIEFLFQMAANKKINLNPYRLFKTQAEQVQFVQSLSSRDFDNTVQDLHRTLLRRFSRTSEEKYLVVMSRMLYLLKKLGAFSLSSEEFDELENINQASLSTNPDFLTLTREVQSVLRSMKSHVKFYEIARSRNDRFAENIIEKARKNSAHGIIVVAGGFHSESIELALHEQGFDVFSFLPYSRNTDRRKSLESLLRLANSHTLAPAAAPLESHMAIGRAAIQKGEDTGNAAIKAWGDNVLRRYGGKTVARFWNKILSKVLNIKKSIIKTYYEMVGLEIEGVSLHGGKKVSVRIFPRGPGNGINFIRTDIPDRPLPFLTISAKLKSLRRHRRRFTGLEYMGVQVATVEHLLFACRVLGIWDADIQINSDEAPILDGSAEEYMRRLRPLARASVLPPIERFERPVVFRRDDNTAIIVLPLEPDEVNSEFIFVGNYPGFNFPIESRIEFNEDDDFETLLQKIGNKRTFVERSISELRKQGLFQGARAGENIIQLGSPTDLATQPELTAGIAAHKGGIDLIGDFFLWELSEGRRFRGRVIALGTGHRDTAELLYRIHSGYSFKMPYERLMQTNLKKLRESGRITDGLYQYLQRRLFKHAHLDEDKDVGDASDVEAHQSPVIQNLADDEIKRLEHVTHLIGKPKTPEIEQLVEVAKVYLFSGSGWGLYDIAESVATQMFVPNQIDRIEFKVSEISSSEVVFEVSFIRGAGLEQDSPKVALVVSRHDNYELFQKEWNETYQAGRNNERVGWRKKEGPLVRRAHDQRMEYFPKLGQRCRSVKLSNGEFRGVYVREWFSKDFAVLKPFESVADADYVPFRAFWKAGNNEISWQMLSLEQQQNAAYGIAEMMTTFFCRTSIPKIDGVSSESLLKGLLMSDIDFSQDVLFDPIDQKVALSRVRQTKLGTVKELLDQIFHMTYVRKDDENQVRGVEINREYQMFCEFIPYLALGIERALVRHFDDEKKGKKLASTWLEQYAALLSRSSSHESIDNPNKTWRVREVKTQDGKKSINTASSVEGPLISKTLSESIGVLKVSIHDLESEEAGYTALGTARWLVDLMSSLTGSSQNIWVKLAPLTEAIVFPFVGVIMGVGVRNLFEAHGLFGSFELSVVAAVIIGQSLWILSHQQIYLRQSARIGIYKDGWYRPGDFSGWPLQWFRMKQDQVFGLGIIVVGLPTFAAFLGSVPVTQTVYIFSVGVHMLFNSGVQFSSDKNMNPMSIRKRQRRALLQSA